ncbi:nucleotidyltransferase family protein [Alteriqipengyuania sp. WL0013]|uniref:nucleotidyltransferase family protein n=1 Tax=Alteriqipengyuania sp. WL0013 TaxID=3110773 RepID=UPI002B9CFA23|nr:nucleotidyltransferase family protein [Alteriqipengyuania sp. WL0013]MEB3416496.1 nucleotidyltransferase family protein [Alteriqipengyuania sp. WL0013]
MSEAARTALLALLGDDAGPAGALDEREWSALAAMAADHRLGPLLHRLHSGSLPASLAAECAAAHRRAALSAMALQRARLALRDVLGERGIEPLFLKGSALALHAYAEPALRPMRDLDVLVPPDKAQAAWYALLAAGYEPAEPVRHDFATLAAAHHHLPLLVGPDGVEVELHMRLWSRADDPLMPREPEDVFGKMVGVDGLAFPSPEHQFAHLVVHAVHVHSLDAGPLVLVDIARLAEAHPLDWDAIWAEADRAGWARAAALIVTLAERWVAPGLLARSRCPLLVPDSVVAAAPDLLLQPLAERHRAIMLAGLGKSELPQTRATAPRPWRDPRWLANRAGRLANAVMDPGARRRAAQMTALHAWLGD